MKLIHHFYRHVLNLSLALYCFYMWSKYSRYTDTSLTKIFINLSLNFHCTCACFCKARMSCYSYVNLLIVTVFPTLCSYSDFLIFFQLDFYPINQNPAGRSY